MTTKEAYRYLLQSNYALKYSLVAELYNDLGHEEFFKICERFQGKRIVFPSQKEVEEFLLKEGNNISLNMKNEDFVVGI